MNGQGSKELRVSGVRARADAYVMWQSIGTGTFDNELVRSIARPSSSLYRCWI